MFLIKVTYTKPLDVVEPYVALHRNYLQEGYDKDYFVVSGPQNPRVGGIIISQLKDRKLLEAFLEKDPYQMHKVADYEIIEFTPVMFHRDFACFMET